ncbi:DKNYY domain-containing protein [Entomohabitans teleogrylli]|uniref:DKNYY domain-containing protein n=1 Tax=Entomohabitans teleogrylli TaxID=1384589 RepID=UPI00073D37DE|nr:DKNYY domain-containing protein [Entomohabitans teleogrylli]
MKNKINKNTLTITNRPLLTILISFMFISPGYSAFDSCKEYWHADGKVKKKACKKDSEYQRIDKNIYVLYDNKIWYPISDNKTYNQRKSCTSVICMAPNMNILPEIRREKTHYYLLDINPQKIKTFNKENSCLRKFYISDNVNVYYNDKKIKGADPLTFQLYHPENKYQEDLGCQLAWDKNNIYMNGISLNVQVTGKVRVINSSFISTGQHIYAVNWPEDRTSPVHLTLRRDVSTDLDVLPGTGLSADQNNLFYHQQIIESLSGSKPVAVQKTCPIPGYPLLRCVPSEDSTFTDYYITRTNKNLWIQRNIPTNLKKIAITPQDNIHYFRISYKHYIIINNALYSLNDYLSNDSHQKHNPFIFSDFLMSYYSENFIDRYGVILSTSEDRTIANRRSLTNTSEKKQYNLRHEKYNKKTGEIILRDNTHRYYIQDEKLEKIEDIRTKKHTK